MKRRILLAMMVALMPGSFAYSQISVVKCGVPPIPPVGCKVGDCVCDQSGNNCHYVFVCK